MNAKRSLNALLLMVMFAATVALPQSGGPFVIQKSVISSGGQSTGGTFTLDQTLHEPIAGTTSSGGNFILTSGFWGDGGAVPTRSVSVSGQVFTPTGAGLRSATVTITDQQGNSSVTLTSSLGFYNFDSVTTGRSYTIRVTSKRFRFSPRSVTVTDDLAGVNFNGVE